MKQATLLAFLSFVLFIPAAFGAGVEVKIKTATQLRERLDPERVIMEVPEGATFDVERMEGEWLIGVYMHSTGISRGIIHKDAVLDPEKLAELEKEYEERRKIREEQEMRAQGYVKYEGEWVTPEEKKKREEEKFDQEMRAKGLVKFEGKWMTSEERATIIKDRYAQEVTTLISTLKDPAATREQKDQAEKRLVEIRDPAIQPLIDEVKSPDRGVRGVAAVILGKIGGRVVLKPLLAALDDEDACAGAAAGLGELGDRQGVAPLIQALQDEDAVRAAAEALGKIGDVRAVVPLIKAMQDIYEDDATHATAAKALGMIGDARALDPLKDVMENNKNPLVREAAREAYNKIKEASPASAQR